MGNLNLYYDRVSPEGSSAFNCDECLAYSMRASMASREAPPDRRTDITGPSSLDTSADTDASTLDPGRTATGRLENRTQSPALPLLGLLR